MNHTNAISHRLNAAGDGAAPELPAAIMVELPWTQLQRQRRILSFGAAYMAAAFVAMLGLRTSIQQGWGVLAIGIPMIVGAWYFVRKIHQARTRPQNALDGLPDGASPQDAAEALAAAVDEPVQPKSLVSFFPSLVQNGLAGTSIYIAHKHDVPPLAPIEFHFEPRALDSRDSAFRELAAGLQANDEACAEKTSEALDDSAGSQAPKSIAWIRWFAISGAIAWIISSTFLSRKAGFPTEFFLPAILLYVAVILRPHYGPASQRWQIAPQLLIMRTRPAMKGDVTLRLFERSKCLLVAIQIDKLRAALFVSDDEECQLIIAPLPVVAIAFRAWLSPVTPPPADRMSDLE